MPPSEIEEAALASSSFIASKAAGKPNIPLSALDFTNAHGDGIYEKIQKVMGGGAADVRMQALLALNNLLKKDDGNVHKAIESGVFTELVLACGDAEVGVRQLASLGLVLMSSCYYGREYSVQQQLMDRFTLMMNDKDDSVRINVYRVLYNVGEDREGLKSIVASGSMALCTEKLKEEVDAIKPFILRVMLLMVSHEKFDLKHTSNAGVVEGLTEELVRLNDIRKESVVTSDQDLLMDIMTGCCECLKTIAINFEGKDSCVVNGSVPEIFKVLANPGASNRPDVRSSAWGAISNITIALQGKVSVLKETAVLQKMIESTTDSVEDVCVYALQSLANTSEHPQCLEVAGDLLSQKTWTHLKQLESDGPTVMIKMSAADVVKKITLEAHMQRLPLYEECGCAVS